MYVPTGTTYIILCIPHYVPVFINLYIFPYCNVRIHQLINEFYCIFIPTYVRTYVHVYIRTVYVCMSVRLKCVTVNLRVPHFLHCWRRGDFHYIVLLLCIPHLVSANQLAATDVTPVTLAHGHLHAKWLGTVDNV